MNLDELLSKRLILLSGKGGVGKTTVAVSLAMHAQQLKKKTLIIEMNSTERVAPLFGFNKIGHEEIPLAPYLTGINLDPHDCFEEYVLMQVKFKKIFDLFINNRFVTAFLNAVPGFNELLMVGKIYDLERQTTGKIGKKPKYDLIIVDAPATGHGLSVFGVPQVVKKMVKVGPLHSQAERMIKLLQDKQKTAFSVVTLAEEMPVAETTEMLQKIKDDLHIQCGPLFVNNVHTSLFDISEIQKIEDHFPNAENDLYPYFAYSYLNVKRSLLNKKYQEILAKKNPELNLIVIDHLYHPINDAKDLKGIL